MLISPFILLQVVDLHEVPPECALEFCKLLPNHRTRILVCGGDGSVGWVLAALDKVKIKVCKNVNLPVTLYFSCFV